MGSRIELQHKLEKIIPNVYYEPSSNVKIQYPAIVYDLAHVQTFMSDNEPFLMNDVYTVTCIDRVPWTSDKIKSVINQFRYINYDRSFINENLHHYVFTIYF